MAIAGVHERGQMTLGGSGWGWRAEGRLIWHTLRSGYAYLAALFALVALTLAYQPARPTTLAVGGGYDAPYLRGFYVRADGATDRWASGAARIIMPGVGARDSTLLVTAATRPDGVAQPVRVVVNGLPAGEFIPTGALTTYRIDLPQRFYAYGDLTVDLLSTPQLVPGRGAQPLPYGPRVSEVRIEPTTAGGPIKPPLWLVVAWGLIGPLLYFLLHRLNVRPPIGLAASMLILAAGALLIPFLRLDLALFAPRLAVLLIVAYLFLVASDLIVPRLFTRGGVTITPAEWRWLQLLVVIALALKLGGIIYPQLIVIDRPFHEQQFDKVLQGRFLELYRPDPNGISAVPGHWGIQAQIPYSPFLYVLGLPFYLWPLGKELSFDLWSGLFDVSRMFLVFYLARRLGATARAGLLAAFVMGLTACTFLLHSWGNYPTTVSQYTALLFITFLVANSDRLRRPWIFLGLAALLMVTMLLYTVTAVFIGLLLVLLIVVQVWRHRWVGRQRWLPLTALLIAGSLVAFFAYYVQYIGPLLTQTLPAFEAKLGQDQVIGGAAAEPLGRYLLRYAARLLYYGVLISLSLAPLGGWLLARRRAHDLTGPLLASWFAGGALFMLLATRLDMVDKEVWFIVPAAAICAGVAADALLRGEHRGLLRGILLAWPLVLGILSASGVRLLTLDPNRFVEQFLALAPLDWLLAILVAGGAVAVSLWRQQLNVYLDRALLALYLGYLTWGGLALWVFRISIVRH